MNAISTPRPDTRLKYSVALLALSPLLAADPSLRITSPADRTVYHPGDAVTVMVEANPPTAFQVVLVGGTDRIGYSDEQLVAPPFRFTVHIPRDAALGRHYLTATGFAPSYRRFLNSPPITLVVERAESPDSIIVYPTAIDLTFSQKGYLQVTGRFKDGSTADLSQSSRIKYVSSVPAIATVQAQGIVTPVSPGAAKIVITYGDLKLEVPVTVRKAQP